MKYTMLAVASLMLTIACGAHAEEPVADAWLDDDAEARALAVNEGRLEILPLPPDRPVHHHHNEIVIDADSLRTGWIHLRQCHENLDPVGATEIVYHPQRIRKLRIESRLGIAEARIEHNTVQLSDIERGARLCISAESQALQRVGDGLYELRNGPYMRRFLDGYYPMRVSMVVHHPPELELLDVEPQAQRGFEVLSGPDAVAIDTWFEGRLYTRLRFCSGARCTP